MKLPRDESDAVHHCINRTPGGDFLFDDIDKEAMCRIRAKVAKFCGIILLTFTFMDNHTHDGVVVPRWRPVSDEEYLERYVAMYPKPTRSHPESIEVIKAKLKRGGPEADAWRQWMDSQTDISNYQKLFKQHVTEHFNRRRRRFGTIWAGRFKNVLTVPGRIVLGMMAYIDLNSFRAGIVEDPKDYRFCGYAAAVAGDLVARRGIMWMFDTDDWEKAQAEYRTLLFTIGTKGKEDAARIGEEHCRQVLKEGGKLSLGVVARCKVAYYTRGLVIGSQSFVEEQLQRLRERTGMKFKRGPVVLPETEWGEWACLTAVRRRPGELTLA